MKEKVNDSARTNQKVAKLKDKFCFRKIFMVNHSVTREKR